MGGCRSAISSAYSGTYSVLPIAAYVHTLMYRKDLFERHNISVPRTWDDLIMVLGRHGNKDLDGDGIPEMGFCFASSTGVCVCMCMRRWGDSDQTPW